MPALIERLRQAPQGFDLFQALHLLERAEPQRRPLGTSLGLDEAVRLSGPTSLAFAPSDIVSVSASDRPGPALTLSSAVMTLAGAQGALPLPVTEMLLEAARQREGGAQAFLDIFQQRLLGFLYRGRRKHRVALAGHAWQAAPTLRVLDAVSGLGCAEGARGPQGQRAWLRHSGLQGAAPRSMASLLALVGDRLGMEFKGESFVGGWLPLADEARARLGPNAPRGPGLGIGLGGGLSLGARAWDPGAGIALTTPSLRLAQFESLLPGQPAHGLLAWLVARHQQQDLQVKLRVNLADAPPTRLCTRRSADASLPPRLGLATWLRGPVQSPRFLLRLQGPNHGH